MMLSIVLILAFSLLLPFKTMPDCLTGLASLASSFLSTIHPWPNGFPSAIKQIHQGQPPGPFATVKRLELRIQ